MLWVFLKVISRSSKITWGIELIEEKYVLKLVEHLS